MVTAYDSKFINNFHINTINADSILVENKHTSINVIEIVPDSLITKKILYKPVNQSAFVTSDVTNDVLKIVVLNRYSDAKPQVGFIKGYGLKKGAIASTVAHDSHNIIAVGVSDDAILRVIERIQQIKGGLVVYDDNVFKELCLPIAGLMSDQPCDVVASNYQQLNLFAKTLGTQLNTPFMTLAFMSLLVIPELKLGDKGLFDVNQFQFIELQN
jgi:adenine deaminase